MKAKTRTVKQIMLAGEWITLKDLCIEDKKFICNKYPELKIHFKRSEIEN